MIVEAPKLEIEYHYPLSAEEALGLGKAMLKAAFSQPYGNTPTGGYMLNEALRLEKKSIELGGIKLVQN